MNDDTLERIAEDMAADANRIGTIRPIDDEHGALLLAYAGRIRNFIAVQRGRVPALDELLMRVD